MAKTITIPVKVPEVPEMRALLLRANVALSVARAWLAPDTPQWVRDAVNVAFKETYR